MGALGRAVEWLRPLVQSKEWDYCVIWKLSDDPSRFIDWVNCCCGGGDGFHKTVKEEGGEQFPLCRDVNFQHPIRTNACVKLAQYPFSVPLYSGIHGEVAMSNQSRWLSYASSSNSNNETVGTQVLIPIVGGLVELFSTRNVPNDQKLIEFITTYYNVSLEQEIMATHSHTAEPFMDEHLNDEYPLNCIPRLQSLVTVEGSSTGSTPSNEYILLQSGSSQVSPNLSPIKSIGNSSKSWKRKMNEEMSKNEVIKAAAATLVDKKDKLKCRQKTTGKEQFHSKNLITERNRRIRIKEGLFTLRALVPNITKMDRAAILGDAIDYIQDLENTARKFQAELKEMEEAEHSKDNGGSYEDTKHPLANENIQHMEMEVEINQIGQREFLLNVVHNQKRDGFLRLMKAIHSLGLQVIDANVTTCKGRVLNILRIQATQEEVEPQNLKDLLHTSWTL